MGDLLHTAFANRRFATPVSLCSLVRFRCSLTIRTVRSSHNGSLSHYRFFLWFSSHLSQPVNYCHYYYYFTRPIMNDNARLFYVMNDFKSEIFADTFKDGWINKHSNYMSQTNLLFFMYNRKCKYSHNIHCNLPPYIKH